MPRYQPSDEELAESEVALQEVVTTEDVIQAVYKADCIRIGEETARRLIGAHPNWNAKQIASEFVTEQLVKDFGELDPDIGYDPDEVPDCFE